MAVEIKNHSDGSIAGVTQEHQLKTRAEVHELQHHVARHRQDTYQVISVDPGITAKTQTIMHIKNTSSTKQLVVSFIRIQAVTDPTHPAATDYFEMGLGRTVASGGTETTPVNTNASSGKTAEATCTGIDPTMAGTFAAIDRWYIPADGQEVVFNKQGSIILGLGDTFEIRFVCSGTGESKARVTFMMMDMADLA